MPQPDQAALDFLLSRRSRPHKMLADPVPDRPALDPILTAALRAPDHGKLEPWRLIVLERTALMRLAGLVGPCGERLGRAPEEIDKQRSQYAGASLAVAVVCTPADHPKVPHVEQVLSTGAVCLQLLNAALASGWGANWLTGWACHDETFAREGLGVEPPELIAGLIHIGTATNTPPERPRPDPAAKVTWIAE